jgi:hypothetical protein
MLGKLIKRQKRPQKQPAGQASVEAPGGGGVAPRVDEPGGIAGGNNTQTPTKFSKISATKKPVASKTKSPTKPKARRKPKAKSRPPRKPVASATKPSAAIDPPPQQAAPTEPTPDTRPTAWMPLPGPQTAFVQCHVFEILFGGSRGGGKTDSVLGDWLLHSDQYGADAIGLMIRRTRVELLETFERARVIYSRIGAEFTANPMRVVMRNGARLTFAYLEHDADADRYQGLSLTRLYIEEAGNFPSYAPIAKLMATLRSGANVPVGMRLTANPGGVGQLWVRARYIDPAPKGWRTVTDPGTGLERIYIPSRVQDNPYLGPDYIQRLKAVGSPELVKAWLEGDWSVVSGAYFPEWSSARHVIHPRALPDHWMRFRSFDWGSARPFCCHWWAVSDGTEPGLAKGALVCYREWYGMKPGEPNVGLRLSVEAIAHGIKEREADDPKPMTGVADPAMWAEDGGPSLAQRMASCSVVFRPADNRRVARLGAIGGWDQLRARLVGDEDGNPMIVFFSTCIDLIRTLPAMQHDPARPEDLHSDMEDHPSDSARYAVMSRSYIKTTTVVQIKDSWSRAFDRVGRNKDLQTWKVA